MARSAQCMQYTKDFFRKCRLIVRMTPEEVYRNETCLTECRPDKGECKKRVCPVGGTSYYDVNILFRFHKPDTYTHDHLYVIWCFCKHKTVCLYVAYNRRAWHYIVDAQYVRRVHVYAMVDTGTKYINTCLFSVGVSVRARVLKWTLGTASFGHGSSVQWRRISTCAAHDYYTTTMVAVTRECIAHTRQSSRGKHRIRKIKKSFFFLPFFLSRHHTTTSRVIS